MTVTSDGGRQLERFGEPAPDHQHRLRRYPQAIRVKDDEGRVGTVDVTVPERSVNITPTSGRVGTIAVVRGENFPSKNDEGTSFNVTVEYGSGTGGTTVTAVPDASGTFEVQLRIPDHRGHPVHQRRCRLPSTSGP